jgi:CRP-like cAMP-binding protein
MGTLATTTVMKPAVAEIARMARPTAPGGEGPRCALSRKLDGLAPLDEQDRAALRDLINHVRPVERHAVLVEQGSVADHAIIVFTGFACRDKRRASGRRQIVAYLTPGDLCDRGVVHDYALDHAIEALTRCLIAKVPRTAYLDLLGRHPRIAFALQRAKLAEEATAHEWVANVGMRSGIERTAHLLCELTERLGAVGHVTDGQYDLPLTQVDLADTLGLSSVHVNRVLQVLRRDKLISLSGHRVRILAPRRLREIAEFEAGYL